MRFPLAQSRSNQNRLLAQLSQMGQQNGFESLISPVKQLFFNRAE
jgi:hypothetical protein